MCGPNCDWQNRKSLIHIEGLLYATLIYPATQIECWLATDDGLKKVLTTQQTSLALLPVRHRATTQKVPEDKNDSKSQWKADGRLMARAFIALHTEVHSRSYIDSISKKGDGLYRGHGIAVWIKNPPKSNARQSSWIPHASLFEDDIEFSPDYSGTRRR